MAHRPAALALLATMACAAGTASQPETPVTPVTPRDSVPLAFTHDPRTATHLSVAGGRLSVRFLANPGRVLEAAVISGTDSVAMWRQVPFRTQEFWRGTLPDGATSYRIRLRTSTGSELFGPFTVPSTLFRSVPWVEGAVGYQIFPDRFENGDPTNDSLALTTDEYTVMPWALPALRPWSGAPVTEQLCCHEYFGGDLAGITRRLDSLAALGVTLLYINPIFASGSAHGYDTWDYLAVEPSFGTQATLRTLLDQAKARGMHVLFDFVPNHVGLGFPGFRDAVRNGTASTSWNWFLFKVPAGQVQLGNAAHYETFAGSAAMPKLDTRTPAVQEYLLGVARTWLQFGFDGIRVDVPNELPNASDFARALRQTAKAVKPDAYLVGEIWQRAPWWVQGDQYDALMHYAIGQDIIEPFATGRLNAVDAANAIGLVFGEYPEASTAMAFNVMSTHDTPRLLTKLGAGALFTTPSADMLARQRLASAMLFAMPGVAVTFQGDECGFTGAMNENRYPVQWAQCNTTVRAHYEQLGRFKRTVPALGSAAFRLHAAEGAVLSWIRGENAAGELLAVFNNGLATSASLPAGSWKDLVTGATHTTRVDVGALGWRYLVRQ